MKKGAVVFLFLLVVAVGLTNCSKKSAGAATGAGDKFPDRPIRFILANGAGGSMENSARRWQRYFEEAISVPLQFEFIEGSGMLIGSNVAATSEPDGYTLMMLSAFDLCNTIVNLDAPYSLASFDMLGIYAQDYTAVMVRKDSKWNTMQELLDYMKTQPPETVSMALTNLATSDTLGVTEIENIAGVKFNKVPFNSGGKARTALIGGQADAGHFSLFGSAAILEDVKVLAINSAVNRSERFAAVPTVEQVLGTPVHDIFSDYGVMAPKGLFEKYPERAQKLLDAFHTAWRNPELMKTLSGIGEDVTYTVLSREDSQKRLDDLFTLVKENASVLTGE